MLKGHVFKKQRFGNQIFALFVDTFLNGKCGIVNYKNKMTVSYTGSNVTVNSGCVCIKGRFIEEDTSTTLSAGTDNLYCKLVIEIDLSKENTETELVQASYKILKSASAYPNLTQTDIVKNNTGVYQHELARFKTGTNGIIEFQDTRTYLDFNSIYSAIQTEYRNILKQLEQEFANVKDGSDYVLKTNYKAIVGEININASTSNSIVIPFEDDFTIDNTVCVACGLSTSNGKGYNFIGTHIDSSDGLNNAFRRRVNITGNGIKLTVFNPNTTALTVNYKIILMKL